MSFKRNTNLLRPSPSPRSCLKASSHVSIDSILKDLKNLSRRLNVAIVAFKDEYKLLERLYYKGKNQHRLSLYWRRVSEIRRLCHRLDETRVDYTVDMLRRSFFDLEAQTKSFSLAIQSGAFLQLMLALIAVVSRFRAVCQLLEENLQLILGISTNVMNLLHTALSENTTNLPLDALENDDTVIEIAGPAASTLKHDLQSSRVTMPARTILKRDVPSPAKAQGKKISEDKVKRRRKTTTDEIDDIFGL
ncbi:hypothetical protein H0H92_002647 [Tricholoma furcatifolium]|nr:hypothetical protein H0H92_002647 [Tricholoma furcatifolium]